MTNFQKPVISLRNVSINNGSSVSRWTLDHVHGRESDDHPRSTFQGVSLEQDLKTGRYRITDDDLPQLAAHAYDTPQAAADAAKRARAEAEAFVKDVQRIGDERRGHREARNRQQGRRQDPVSRARREKQHEAQAKRDDRIAAAKAERGDKPAWQVTADTWATSGGYLGGSGRDLVLSDHRAAVEKALAAGEDVPADVLADYPDIERPARESDDPQQAYDAAMEQFRAVSREHTETTRRYRAREVDDAAFLASKARLDEAQAAADAAEVKLLKAPRKPKTVDVNEFGEAQPRLPGAEQAREDATKAEPQFEVPFALQPNNAPRPAEGQTALFDTIRPARETTAAVPETETPSQETKSPADLSYELSVRHDATGDQFTFRRFDMGDPTTLVTAAGRADLIELAVACAACTEAEAVDQLFGESDTRYPQYAVMTEREAEILAHLRATWDAFRLLFNPSVTL